MTFFRYFGAMLNEKCDNDVEVRVKIGQAKNSSEKCVPT